MACQIKCIVLVCSVHLQPFMICESERKQSWLLTDVSLWFWYSARPPNYLKSAQRAVNLTVFFLFHSQNDWLRGGNRQLCECTHSVWCCWTCFAATSRSKQQPGHHPMNKTFPKTIKLSLTCTVKSHAPLLWWLSARNAIPGLRRACRGRKQAERSIICSLSLKQRGFPPRPPCHHLWTFPHGSAAGKSDNWLDCCTVRAALFFSYLIRDSHTAALKFQ